MHYEFNPPNAAHARAVDSNPMPRSTAKPQRRPDTSVLGNVKSADGNGPGQIERDYRLALRMQSSNWNWTACSLRLPPPSHSLQRSVYPHSTFIRVRFRHQKAFHLPGATTLGRPAFKDRITRRRADELQREQLFTVNDLESRGLLKRCRWGLVGLQKPY
ncbi:hypothetical protein B0H17DRAFT_1129561 [Mycena rosella]|uniref:Uncharacterized protein n=1 Tax=Mycena rosella TaxID=1033263 RepID=A0AAD7GQ23_MYCRO|nr:hypothetical protein B0H17DRAFT_1129561 [Mycena rosella]